MPDRFGLGLRGPDLVLGAKALGVAELPRRALLRAWTEQAADPTGQTHVVPPLTSGSDRAAPLVSPTTPALRPATANAPRMSRRD
jgi:hypothetical protein